VLDPPTGQFTAFAFGVMVSPYGFSEASDTGVCAKVTVNQGTVFSEEPSCPSEGSAVALVYGQATQAGTYTASGTVSFGGCFDDAYGDCTVFGLSVPNMQASVTFNPVACSPPTIDSILVNGQPISELVIPTTNGTMLISGACLDNTTQVSIGSDPDSDNPNSVGVTLLSVTPLGWGGVSAQYTVASGTVPQTVVLTVSTSSGSATQNLDLVAAGPYIEWIVPTAWSPGTTTNVTISGSGFGTNQGSLAITAPNGDVSLVNIQSWSDNAIVINAATGPNSADETVTIKVYGGTDSVLATGFQAKNGPGTGNSAAGLAYVVVDSCGDTRDDLIAEYLILVPQSVYPLPNCSTFTDSASSFYYSFAQLNYPSPKTAPAAYPWAILRNVFVVGGADYSPGCTSTQCYGLDAWTDAYYALANSSAARQLNSVYRSPVKNLQAGGTNNSRHQFGDAADMANASSASACSAGSTCLLEWNNMVAAAKAANADYIEPSSLPCHMSCTHADWRNH
jgi:Peptidase M15/IPT/TIG domain